MIDGDQFFLKEIACAKNRNSFSEERKFELSCEGQRTLKLAETLRTDS